MTELTTVKLFEWVVGGIAATLLWAVNFLNNRINAIEKDQSVLVSDIVPRLMVIEEKEKEVACLRAQLVAQGKMIHDMDLKLTRIITMISLMKDSKVNHEDSDNT